jgi:hypothetical protein
MSLTAVVAVLCAVCQAAAAQAPSSADPSHGSPAEAIYDIPLGPARRDAAPGSGAVPVGVSPVTDYRSENGFGSSAIVPGAVSRSGKAKGRLASAQASQAVVRNRFSDPSKPGFFVLAGLVVLAGSYSGLLAARSLRRVD